MLRAAIAPVNRLNLRFGLFILQIAKQAVRACFPVTVMERKLVYNLYLAWLERR